MTIVVISAVFPPEPIVSAKLSFDIAQSISGKNCLTVVSPKPSRPYNFNFKKSIHSENFKHVLTNSFTCPKSSLLGRFRESYSFGIHCSKYIKQNSKNINLIYANTWPLLAQYYTVKAAKKYNIPIIIHVQDVYPESFANKVPVLSSLLNYLLLPIDKYVLRNATRIISISDKMKTYLVSTRKIAKDKVAVVHNWQDEELFSQPSIQNLLSDTNGIKTFTFMYLGNIGPVAGVDLLIEAFKKTEIENCRLVIAGSGSMKKVLEKTVKEKTYSNIEFWSVPDGKVPEVQSHADILILPIKKGSAASSVPSKLPAYMFSAKPIIACVDDDSDTANAIRQANCGWVIPPEDIDNLANLMVKVCSESKESLKILGQNGYIYSITNYSKKKNLEKLLCIIEEVCKI